MNCHCSATQSPCKLRHGRLVYCDMVALFTQSEGKPITVTRQPLPCFSREHLIEILRHWSPCLFQVQHGNPSLYEISPYYTLKVRVNPSLHCDNRCLVSIWTPWLKSHCVTKFLLIASNVSCVETASSVLSPCYMLTRACSPGWIFTRHLVSTICMRKYIWYRDTVTTYLGQYLQLSENMLRKRPKNRNHYKNHHSIFTSECKQLLPKIYSSCILREPMEF